MKCPFCKTTYNEKAFCDKWDVLANSLDYSVWCRLYNLAKVDQEHLVLEYRLLIGEKAWTHSGVRLGHSHDYWQNVDHFVNKVKDVKK